MLDYTLSMQPQKEKNQSFSFEPSSSNLRTLSRNISINNLQNKINIVPFALSKNKNKFLLLKKQF